MKDKCVGTDELETKVEPVQSSRRLNDSVLDASEHVEESLRVKECWRCSDSISKAGGPVRVQRSCRTSESVQTTQKSWRASNFVQKTLKAK